MVVFLLGTGDVVVGFTVTGSIRSPKTLLAASPRLNSVTAVKKKRNKTKVDNNDDEDGELKATFQTGLPPALTIDGLTCSHDGGTVYQLKDVSYVLPRQRKIGLVGRNGCGKSTLMKIIAETCCGEEFCEVDAELISYTGEIELPRDVTVAFVEQEPLSPSDITVADALLGIKSSQSATKNPNSVFQIVRNYNQVCNAAEFDDNAFDKASAAMDKGGGAGWDVFTKMDEIATRLRLDDLKDQSLSKLSGGERKRVALGAALVQTPDVLLLDEPTNHLVRHSMYCSFYRFAQILTMFFPFSLQDLNAIRLLSDIITAEKKMTVLCITHDR